MRKLAKGLAETVTVHSGLARLASLRVRGRRLVLAYHNVVPRGERAWGERTLHLSAARFGEHLDVLAGSCHVVPLDVLLTGRDPATGTRPLVAVTFDDAYAGAVEAGTEELRRRGLPATFFVAPGLSGEPGFWWDRLAHPSGGALPDRVRSDCLTRLEGRQERVIAWARSEGRAAPAAPAHSRPAGEERLVALSRVEGVTLASHTWSHPNLAALDPEAQGEELARPPRWFADRRIPDRPWLAYPYGLVSRGARAAAATAGYQAAFLIEGGWIPDQRGRTLELPRLNVPAGLSPEGLRLRVAGVLAA